MDGKSILHLNLFSQGQQDGMSGSALLRPGSLHFELELRILLLVHFVQLQLMQLFMHHVPGGMM